MLYRNESTVGENTISYTKDYLNGTYKICITIKQIVSIMWMPFYCVWVNSSDTKISFPYLFASMHLNAYFFSLYEYGKL